MHGTPEITRDEEYREKVEQSGKKTGRAEFRRSVLPPPMVDRQFGYPESVPAGQYRNVAVHLSVQLYSFDHLAAVGFYAAVEVVDGDAGKEARNGVEQL